MTPTHPHLLARVDELAKIEERAEASLRQQIYENGGVPLDDSVKPEQYRYYVGYLAGAASQRPAIEALREAVTALENIGHTQDISPADPETGGPCRIAIANSRNRRILEAQEALRNIARLIEGEKKHDHEL